MKAKYENDPGRGAGYGLIRLKEPGQFLSAAGSTPQYGILRSSDHRSLHPGGWEDSECRLDPDGVREDGAELLLLIGPTTVRQLDELNTYRFVLHLGGETRKASLELAGIVYPPEDERGGVAGVAPEVKPVVKAKPAPAPEPEPAPPVEGLLAPQPEMPLDFGSSQVEHKPSRLPLLLALLAGLIAVAAAVWFFVLREKTPETATPPAEQEKAAPEQKPAAPEAATEPAAEPAPKPAPAQAAPKQELPAPAQTAPTPKATALERARKLLRDAGKPAEALSLAKELTAEPAAGATAGTASSGADNRDAAFLLLEVAAEGGEAEAMLALGGFYDPADAAPKGSILPDAEQAWLWYGKAEQAGQADAKNRRAALRAKVEQDAAAGKAEAQVLLNKLN